MLIQKQKKIERVVKITKAKKVIFVGDTHGDLDASQKVIKEYLKRGNKIVFLGDYVDRGPNSKQNLDFLLKVKEKYPTQIYLLQGNHEGHRIHKFTPDNFWRSLTNYEYQKYATIVESFPFAITVGSVIALHAVLPDIKKLNDFNKIQLGDENWFRICWGDFSENDETTLRETFDREYFERIMKRLNKKILIRAHQNCKTFMFDEKCVTIFTSSAYLREKTIAVYDLSKRLEKGSDLEIRVI